MDSGKSAPFFSGIPLIYPWPPEFSSKIWYICRLYRHPAGNPFAEVIFMEAKRRQQRLTGDLRLDPSARLCPAYNAASIKLHYLPGDEMGMRVIDNCAEENQR